MTRYLHTVSDLLYEAKVYCPDNADEIRRVITGLLEKHRGLRIMISREPPKRIQISETTGDK